MSRFVSTRPARFLTEVRHPTRHVAKQGVGHQTRHPSDRYIDWRTHHLLHAGLDERNAARLGRDPAYDLHALLELIDRGCPPPLAVRILAPLDAAPWE